MKKILVIYYSQTGQLGQILQNTLRPLSEHKIDIVEAVPEQPYPFPWTGAEFWGVMPETVLEEDVELKPLKFNEDDYDLIILGYQPWYLSPSPPTIAILKDEEFKRIAKGKPVITVIGSRNMWINSQKVVKKYLKEADAKLIGNIPLVDRHSNLASAVTILYWLKSGKKDKYLGIFPKPGVSEEDIKGSYLFGEKIKESLQEDNLSDIQKKILSLDKIKIRTSILFIEQRAKRLFIIWANLVKKKGTTARKRSFWIKLYSLYVVIALFIVAPLILSFYYVFFMPFTLSSLKRKKAYFCGIED